MGRNATEHKLVKVMQADPVRWKRFLDSLRLGGSVTAGAASIGVSPSAASRAVAAGKRKDATAALKKVRRDVLEAISAARVLTEAELRSSDPKFWLTRGPGRILGDDWDDTVQATQGSHAATLSSTDIIKGLIELHRSGISIDRMIEDGSIHTLAPNSDEVDDTPLPTIVPPRPPVDQASQAAPLLLSADGHPPTPPPLVHKELTPHDGIVGEALYGESSTPIKPHPSKPKMKRTPIYKMKNGTPLESYDPPTIRRIVPDDSLNEHKTFNVQNVKEYHSSTLNKNPDDIGVVGYNDVVKTAIENGDGVFEDSPSLDIDGKGGNDPVTSGGNMERNTEELKEVLLERLEAANEARFYRKQLRELEKEELETLEDSLPDGLRSFLLGKKDN
jgi:hypothetical protein